VCWQNSFEGAGYHPVFLDAAYARMPFATYWCVFRLPTAIADAVESAYRKEIIAGYPELADDAHWHPMVRRAVAVWTVDITVALAARAAGADRLMHSRVRPVPSMRQLLRHRWEQVAEELESAAELPALAVVFRGLLATTERWQVTALPRYPAFRT
jgi:hypothetical protein